jgi:hypothetical protein
MNSDPALKYEAFSFRTAHPVIFPSLLIVFLLSMFLLATFVSPMVFSGQMIAGAAFLEASCLFVIWMLLVALLTMSPVAISSESVTKYLFGIPICTIRWIEIAAVYKIRQRQLYGGLVGSKGYADNYTIRRRGWTLKDALLPNFLDSITFDDRFSNLSTLLNIINEQSTRCGFRLLSTDFQVRAEKPSASWFEVSINKF